MGSSQKAFSGMCWSVLVNIVNAVYGFIAAPLLISYFGRNEYGLIALAGAVNGYMALMDMGLSSTNVRFFSNWIAKGDTLKVKKLMQTCTAFYAVVGVINAIVLFVISLFAEYIFNVSAHQIVILRNMLWVLCVTALINWYTSCFGQLISATENVAWVQKRNLFTKFLMIFVVFATLYFKLTLFQYFIGGIIAGFVVLPATIRKIKRETPYISFLAKFDIKVFREILPYSLNVFSFGFFQFSYNNLKVVMLGIQGDVASVTDNGVMTALAGLVGMIGNVFIGALLPASSRIVAKGDKQGYYKVAYQGTHFITMILCFCAFGLMTVDQDLMMVYVGNQFMHLIPWLNIWLLVTITGNVSCISSLILAGSDIRPLTYSSIVASLVGILTCWFSIPYFKAGGVVISMVAYNAVQEIFYYTYYWPKVLKINSWRIFIHTDIPFITIGGVLAFILLNLPHFENHWANIFVFGLTFAIIYIPLSYFILGNENRKYLFNMLKKKK